MQILLTLCWSLPTLITTILQATNQAVRGVAQSGTTQRVKKKEEGVIDDGSMAEMLACHRILLLGPWGLDLATNKTCQELSWAHIPLSQPETSRLAAKGDHPCNDSPRDASKGNNRNRKKNSIRHRFRDDRDRQPMFGVYIPCQGRLCGRAEAI